MNTLKFLFLLILFYSCKNEKRTCSGFKFGKVPYDSGYYYQTLEFIDDYDTVNLYLSSKDYSKSTEWGFYGFDCNPSFYTHIEDSLRTLQISYEFKYYDNGGADTTLYLDLLINSGAITINVDSIRSMLSQEIEFDKFLNLGEDRRNFIKSIKMKNMRITEIRGMTGRSWRLIEN